MSNSNRPDKDDPMAQQARFVTLERPHAMQPVTLYLRPATPLQALLNTQQALTLATEWRTEALDQRMLRMRDRVEIENLQELLADALWDAEQLRKPCGEIE